MSVRDKIVLLSALIVIVGGALVINGRFNAKNATLNAQSSPALVLPNSHAKELSLKDTDQLGDARNAVTILKDIKPAVAQSLPTTTPTAAPAQPLTPTQPAVIAQNPIAKEAIAAVRATAQLPQTAAAAEVTKPAATIPVATGNTYTVQKGQTLSDIAIAVYKDKSKAITNAKKIYEYNKDQLPSMNQIKIGQKLRIPELDSKAEPVSKLKQFADSMPEKVTYMSSKFVPAPKGKLYVVKKGDSLWSIAQTSLGNGSRYKEIEEANKKLLAANKKLSPGMSIIIPN